MALPQKTRQTCLLSPTAHPFDIFSWERTDLRPGNEPRPIDYFKLFFPDSEFESLAARSNAYKAHKVAEAQRSRGVENAVEGSNPGSMPCIVIRQPVDIWSKDGTHRPTTPASYAGTFSDRPNLDLHPKRQRCPKGSCIRLGTLARIGEKFALCVMILAQSACLVTAGAWFNSPLAL